MKRCPTCNRTYTDESLNFCLADGAFLSAPNDPQPTVASPAPRITESPTEILLAEQLPVNINTVPSPTIPVREKIARKRNFLPWLIAGALAAAFVIYLVIPKGSTPNNSNQAASTGMSPAEVLKAYDDAMKRKDIDAAKKYLSSSHIRYIADEAKSQGKTVDELLKEFADSDPPLVEYSNEKINGDKATVDMVFTEHYKITMYMVKEDGSWKIE